MRGKHSSGVNPVLRALGARKGVESQASAANMTIVATAFEMNREMTKFVLLYPATGKKSLDSVKERVNFTGEIPAARTRAALKPEESYSWVNEGNIYHYVNSFPNSYLF
jgi:hypothetical protein